MAAQLSIGMPVYNGERYLRDALESILGQSFADFEVVISDNGSTDGTEELCREYMQRDSRVQYTRQPENLGAANNYNYVFEHSNAPLFKWAAHDDVCGQGFFQLCIDKLAERQDAVLAFPGTRFIDEEGATLFDYDDELPWGSPGAAGRLQDLLGDHQRTLLKTCSAVCGVIRRDALRKTRLIRGFNGSDNVLLVELALLGDFAQVPGFLFERRDHDGSSLNANASAAEVAQWFDPSQGKRFPLPRTKLFWGHVTSVMRTRLPLREKLACLPVLSRRFGKEWRIIGGEVKIALRERLAPRRQPT